MSSTSLLFNVVQAPRQEPVQKQGLGPHRRPTESVSAFEQDSQVIWVHIRFQMSCSMGPFHRDGKKARSDKIYPHNYDCHLNRVSRLRAPKGICHPLYFRTLMPLPMSEFFFSFCLEACGPQSLRSPFSSWVPGPQEKSLLCPLH